jgi:hypothetical protein
VHITSPLEPKYQIIIEHVLQNSCLDKLLQPLCISPHRTPQLRLSSKSWLEARSERFRVRNHSIHEARFVDRVRWVLCDIERPQEERSIDEDRAVRYVLSRADSVSCNMSMRYNSCRRKLTFVRNQMKGT